MRRRSIDRERTMKKFTLFLTIAVLLVSLSTVTKAKEDLEREGEARYDINYASYLIEVGKYMEALENYETALELTSLPKTKIDALLAKATLLSSFLDAPEEALKVYRQVYTQYPQAAEIARYREGLLLFQLNRYREARDVLTDYLKRYPKGRFIFQAEALLEQIAKMPAPSPPPAPPTTIPKPEKPVPETPTTSIPAPAPPIPSPPVPAPPIPSPPAPVVPVPPPAPPPAPKPTIKTPQVRVRLCKTNGSIEIMGSPVCVDGLGCKEKFTVKGSGGNISINGGATDKKTITFTSRNPLAVECDKEKRKVRGSLTVKQKAGVLMLINLVDMEDYLKSVVPSESYASWPLETLKAQAVAARTYAYYQILHREDWDYDLVADQGDQAYKGMERERKNSSLAVTETEGEILTYKEKPILAMYSANSGGYTADSQFIFSLSKPYLIAHPDPESLNGKMAYWTKKFSVKEVENALDKRGIDISGIERIEAAERGPSGRIIKVRIVSKSGSKVFRTRTTLGRALQLPEILLEITQKDGNFIFEGRGWGHGVGYSQWGSAILGKDTSYKKILAFYYPNAVLEKQW